MGARLAWLLEIFFENRLQLKHLFHLDFERVLNNKWLLSHRNNDISCTHGGARGRATRAYNQES